MMMGFNIWGGLHDDDGDGWHGDMMMLDLHLVVDCHFMIQIIYMAELPSQIRDKVAI